MIRVIFLPALFVLVFLTAKAQNTIGLPGIINYTKQEYSGGTQNWDIRQGANGVLYFANNEGLLSFDGTFWKKYPLPNKTIIRALHISKDGRIYIGAQNDLGYFSPDKTGSLIYQSLLHLIPPKERSFDDIWNICEWKGSVFFRANHKIFQLTNNSIVTYAAPSEWRFMGESNGQLLAEDQQKRLFFFDHGNWIPFPAAEIPAASLLTSYFPLNKDTSIITTLKDGVFTLYHNKIAKINSATLSALAGKAIYKALRLDSRTIALATSFDGCHIIDIHGNLVQSLTHQEGLQTNSIRSILYDRHHNLWLGLDNGIDFISYNNAIRHIYPENQNIGSGYATLVFQSKLYLGTNNGLFYVPISSISNIGYERHRLANVGNTMGQVWGISDVNGQLLVGHHEGAFRILDNKAMMIDAHSGFWTFQPLSSVFPSKLVVAGNYNGLSFFQSNGNIITKTGLSVPFESARYIVVENEHTIWVAHPYKGVYQITLQDKVPATVKLFDHTNSPLSENNNFVFRVKNHMVVASESGIYEYNEARESFEPSPMLNDLFRQMSIRYLKEDGDGNIWFVHEKNIGVVDFSSGKPVMNFIPELKEKMVSGFENIYPYNRNNVFVGGEKGFYIIDYEKYSRQRPELATEVRKVTAIGKSDSLFFGGYTRPVSKNAMIVPFRLNSLHFEFSAIAYGQEQNLEYAYFLDGFDKGWSNWSKKPEKDYTNLPEGDYTFKIKARNAPGNESVASSYFFTISPPWYRSWWSFLFYSLCLMAGIVYFYRWQRRKFQKQQERHEKEQQRLQYLHQLELDKNEKEIVKLRNEKLETEIEFKNSELANSTMHLVQKREMILKIRDDISKLMKKVNNEQVIEECKKVLKVLGEDNRIDENWDQFAQHFDKIHTDFLVQLKEKHKDLTANDMKLCAYLRMNLTSKEMAQLMNISVRGVEVSRYRLRKKLALPTETSLFDYLLSIRKEEETVKA